MTVGIVDNGWTHTPDCNVTVGKRGWLGINPPTCNCKAGQTITSTSSKITISPDTGSQQMIDDLKKDFNDIWNQELQKNNIWSKNNNNNLIGWPTQPVPMPVIPQEFYKPIPTPEEKKKEERKEFIRDAMIDMVHAFILDKTDLTDEEIKAISEKAYKMAASIYEEVEIQEG